MEFIHAVQQALSPTAFWNQVWLAVTYLGSEYAFIVYLALAYWLLGPRVGRRLGFTVAVSFVLNDVLKNAVNGPRPFFDDPSVATPAAQATAGGGGFPSGHAQSAAAFWTLLTLEAGLGWLPLAVLVVAAVAVSRLALGVHYPLDVLGGLFIGLALAFAAAGWPALRLPSVANLVVALAAAYLAYQWLPDSCRPLGVLAGFALSGFSFAPPRGLLNVLVVAVGGLLLVGVLYLALSAAFGEAGHSGLVGFVKYLLLTLVATELWPRMCGSRGWLGVERAW